MVELVDIDTIPNNAVSDDDLLLIYDLTAGHAFKVTRGVLLQGIARLNRVAAFTNLSAEDATFTEVTAALMSFASGGGIADMVTARPSITIPTIAAGTAQTVTIPVSGATLGMAVVCTISDGLAPGLCLNAYVSATNQVSVVLTNATSGSIAGATKSARLILISLPE